MSDQGSGEVTVSDPIDRHSEPSETVNAVITRRENMRDADTFQDFCSCGTCKELDDIRAIPGPVVAQAPIIDRYKNNRTSSARGAWLKKRIPTCTYTTTLLLCLSLVHVVLNGCKDRDNGDVLDGARLQRRCIRCPARCLHPSQALLQANL